jgi:AcrR family transcriptional regulator
MKRHVARAPTSASPASPAVPAESGARRQILDAAAYLLRNRGYEAATTRAIAAAVGIKGGSIYHHFPSKDAIVGEVVNEGVRVVYDAVEKALGALPARAKPLRRLEAAIKADSVRQGCRLERRRYEALWAQLVSEFYQAGLIDRNISPESIQLLLLGALNWAGEWYRPDRMDIDDISRDFAASILRAK